MKRFLFLLAFAWLPVFAQAETQFDAWLAKYDKAEPAGIQDVQGWYAGRCFYHEYEDPDTDYAGIFSTSTMSPENLPGNSN